MCEISGSWHARQMEDMHWDKCPFYIWTTHYGGDGDTCRIEDLKTRKEGNKKRE